MQSEKLVGTWKLVSYEIQTSSGEVIYPFGRDAFGMLMYDSRRNMSTLIMRRDRPKFASTNDLLRRTPEEIKAVLEGIIAYCGTYEVNEEKRTVTHHIEGCMDPNGVGTNQVRFFEFSGDQLLIKSPPLPWGDEYWTFHMIYKRASI